MLRENDKEYYFLRNSEFHAACATIFSQMNYKGNLLDTHTDTYTHTHTHTQTHTHTHTYIYV